MIEIEWHKDGSCTLLEPMRPDDKFRKRLFIPSHEVGDVAAMMAADADHSTPWAREEARRELEAAAFRAQMRGENHIAKWLKVLDAAHAEGKPMDRFTMTADEWAYLRDALLATGSDFSPPRHDPAAFGRFLGRPVYVVG